MLTDRYGLTVSTASAGARDAYVEGCDLLLSLYPGAADAFDRAIAADPGFALAHVAKARARQLAGDMATARASIATAQAVSGGLPAREASHVAFFALVLSGQPEAALTALREHLAEWPRDILALSTCATPSGLIGASGRNGCKAEQAALMAGLAGSYGDDWCFAGYHAFALAETEQTRAARPIVEASLAVQPRNAWGSHTYAHVCYEDGEQDAARDFIRSWLPVYTSEGPMHGHLCWHLALCELQAGNTEEAFQVYTDCVRPGVHSGAAMTALNDAASFLWRAELAGHPGDPARWQTVRDFAQTMFPRPGTAFADWHVALADAEAGDGTALEERVRQMEDLARAGRYPSGPVVPALARAFAAFKQQDYSAAIDAIEPVLDQRERISGSRAQTDLIEFTLLKAYVNAGRLDDARRLLRVRRPGPAVVPVSGVSILH